MIKLKPCPFCGGEAEVERIGTPRHSCIVDCSDCGCRLESNENGYGAHWNRRAEDPDEVDYAARVDAMLAATEVPNPIQAAFILGREFDSTDLPAATRIVEQVDRLEEVFLLPQPSAEVERLREQVRVAREALRWDEALFARFGRGEGSTENALCAWTRVGAALTQLEASDEPV